MAAILGEIQLLDLIAQVDDVGTGQMDAAATANLNQVIANASGKIDEKCANLYGQQLPFNPVPASVASMALTIACYRVFRRREVPDEKNKFTEEYRNVMEFLDEVNTGDKHLNDVPNRDFPQGAVTGRPVIYSGGVFGTGPLSNTM